MPFEEHRFEVQDIVLVKRLFSNHGGSGKANRNQCLARFPTVGAGICAGTIFRALEEGSRASEDAEKPG